MWVIMKTAFKCKRMLHLETILGADGTFSHTLTKGSHYTGSHLSTADLWLRCCRVYTTVNAARPQFMFFMFVFFYIHFQQQLSAVQTTVQNLLPLLLGHYVWSELMWKVKPIKSEFTAVPSGLESITPMTFTLYLIFPQHSVFTPWAGSPRGVTWSTVRLHSQSQQTNISYDLYRKCSQIDHHGPDRWLSICFK